MGEKLKATLNFSLKAIPTDTGYDIYIEGNFWKEDVLKKTPVCKATRRNIYWEQKEAFDEDAGNITGQFQILEIEPHHSSGLCYLAFELISSFCWNHGGERTISDLLGEADFKIDFLTWFRYGDPYTRVENGEKTNG